MTIDEAVVMVVELCRQEGERLTASEKSNRVVSFLTGMAFALASPEYAAAMLSILPEPRPLDIRMADYRELMREHPIEVRA